MRYHGNKICPDEQTDGQPENIMPTQSDDEGIKLQAKLYKPKL